MRNFGPIWRLVARRSSFNWKMLGILSLGVLVASTLLAAAPVYARTMTDLGLTFTIRDELAATPSTTVLFRQVPLGSEDGRTFKEAIDNRIDERMGWLAASESLYIRGPGLVVLSNSEEETPERPLISQFQSMTGYEDHVRLVEGTFPRVSPPGSPVEVALPLLSASTMGLAVGDTFVLRERLDDCFQMVIESEMPSVSPCPEGTPTFSIGFEIEAIVVAIVEAPEEPDPFWVGNLATYFETARGIPGTVGLVPLFIAPGQMEDSLATAFPSYRADTVWNVYVDPEVITQANMKRARSDIDDLRQELFQIDGITVSPLVGTIERFEQSSAHQQTPLTILVLQIAAIALFYVALVASIVIERQSDEIALLRSRGASIRQVLVVYLLEGLIIGVPALLLAPLLAAAATALLGLAPTFDNVTDETLLPVSIPPRAFMMAGVGVVLSMAALLVPAFVVARRTAVAQRRAEARPGISIMQKYYLDLILAGFAALLLWELNERGSAFEPSATGGVTTDPILLASPALIIASAAALVMRFYPMLLRLGSRLLSTRAGIPVGLGLWQVVRSPGQYLRLALLLMMAVAVGTFAASYSSTANRSYRDRADFEAGVDLRGIPGSLPFGGTVASKEVPFAELPGVAEASLVYRDTHVLGTSGSSGRQVQVLGVDPTAAARMLITRADFADESIESLLFLLQGSPRLLGRPLPPGTTSLSIQVNSQDIRKDVTVWVRIRDEEDRYQLFEVGELDATGWRELTATLSGPLSSLKGQLTLVGILMTEPANQFNTTRSSVFFDEITAIGEDGSRTLIDGLDGDTTWLSLPSAEETADEFEIVGSEEAFSGAGAAKLGFRVGVQQERRGIYPQDAIIPIGALASKLFMEQTGSSLGTVALMRSGDALVPYVIRGTFDLFPTLPSSDGPALIFNRDQLADWTNAFTFNPSGFVLPGEIWLTLEPDADREALVETLEGPDFRVTHVVDRILERETIEKNPLIAAGGAGILLVSFAAILVLVGAAMLVSLWMAVQRRRTEFAVMRAMGISRGQILRLLTFEYALVAIVGLLVGSYLGLLVGRRMLSFLDVTETGDRVEPGFILQTDWTFVAGGAAAVFGIFVLALIVAVRVLGRTSDAQALRTE